MRHFDIIKTSQIDKTFRVAKIESDFDLKASHSNEHFIGDFDLPDKWQIGLIVGGSGTGKTTIAKNLFGDNIVNNLSYTHKSVIDDMPKSLTVTEISKMFYAVGFGSVPSWLKPYSVLSNGEKMRVDIARAISERDFTVFDEFTSVVDRQVAKVASLAISKMIRKTDKQFIAISCHHDVEDWLAPDWVFNTDTMKFSFTKGTGNLNGLKSENVSEANGQSLGNIII
ncbi:putative ABC iron siderophore transporter [Oenococcus phage vB_OeS_unk162]|nr:putative ABC iron siderophore transporter [Oenococcus phage vB_OeS_unk162]